MSVVARAPDGTIRLFCKGSDAKVMRKLRAGTDPALLARTEDNLHVFARQGLRTLVLATRILDEAWHDDWDARYQEAASAFEDRDARLDALGAEVEAELELVGVTAIEDKLQVGLGHWGVGSREEGGGGGRLVRCWRGTSSSSSPPPRPQTLRPPFCSPIE